MRWAWQPLGYLLADTDDRYQIEAVGWYFVRHEVLWTFDADDFLLRMAGHRVDLPAARTTSR